MRIVTSLLAACLLLAAGTETAVAVPGDAAQPAAPRSFVTHHTGVFGGKSLGYTATVGETILSGAGGEPTASIFSTAYIADGTDARRPLVFAYNGGPGSSSAYLHLGALGPVRAVFPTDLTAEAKPPFQVAANPYSPLDAADLVLIDPPETGFSRALPGDGGKSYATILGDAQLVADFIRAWIHAHGREASPTYILGESYGATRTALVAGDLLTATPEGKSDPIHLKGLMLLSQMLTVDDLGPRPMNAAGYATALPSIAAVAWHYGRVDKHGRSFASFLAQAREFALRDYMPALMLGAELAPAERARVADRLAAFSGLSRDFLLSRNLQLDCDTYRRALFPGQLLGAYDGRYVAPGTTAMSEAADPARRQTVPIVSGAIADYLKGDLGVTLDARYVVENFGLGASWYFGDKRRKPATTYLTDYLAKEPDAFVFVAGGYQDLVTPFATAQFLVAHLPLKPGHGEFHAYTGGHMFYSDLQSLADFSRDLHAYIGRTAGAR